MTKTYRHPIWILIILGLGGPIIFALSLYFEISVSLMVYELFYDTTHLVDLPFVLIEQIINVVLALLAYLVMKSRAHAVTKALVIMSPISMITGSFVSSVSMSPIAIILSIISFTGMLFVGIKLARLPWFFYVSVSLSVLISALLMWPRDWA